MKGPKFSFTESAFTDLKEIKKFYEGNHVPEVGVRLLREIVAKTEGLAQNPDMGRVVPEFSQDHIRELIHAPFRIVYFRGEESIDIVRVWRGERRLRLPKK